MSRIHPRLVGWESVCSFSGGRRGNFGCLNVNPFRLGKTLAGDISSSLNQSLDLEWRIVQLCVCMWRWWMLCVSVNTVCVCVCVCVCARAFCCNVNHMEIMITLKRHSSLPRPYLKALFFSCWRLLAALCSCSIVSLSVDWCGPLALLGNVSGP